MPPKKDIKKKKKPLKQKQKQKQIVKQNVRVNVQSSGGSGAGGTSVPAPSPIPYNYFDRTGENVQIRNLVEEAVRRQAIPRVVQLPADAPISQPANDATTFNALFNAPSDLDKPLVAGKGAVSGFIPTARRRFEGEADEEYKLRMLQYEEALAKKSIREKNIRKPPLTTATVEATILPSGFEKMGGGN